jgi:CRISPR type IV-associated protein Csf3
MRPHKGTFRRLPDAVMEPLRITAWLQCGVISDTFLPIDGVLYYTAMRERYGPQEVTWSGQNHPNAVPGVQLPLKRVDGHGPMWFYAASFAQWERATEGQDHWNKRLDLSLVSLIDFRGRRGKIDVAAGAMKSYHMPVFYRHALAARWYAVGYRPEIERLLAHCTHLGKKTSQGWGAVLRWDVEPWPEDWSVRGPQGLMRAIPAERGILTGFRPSYWLPKNQTICAVPAA